MHLAKSHVPRRGRESNNLLINQMFLQSSLDRQMKKGNLHHLNWIVRCLVLSLISFYI